MSGDAGELAECELKTPITPLSRCTALGRVKPELVGHLGKALTRDATEGSGLLSIQQKKCTPWSSTEMCTQLCVVKCL